MIQRDICRNMKMREIELPQSPSSQGKKPKESWAKEFPESEAFAAKRRRREGRRLEVEDFGEEENAEREEVDSLERGNDGRGGKGEKHREEVSAMTQRGSVGRGEREESGKEK